MVSQIFSIFVGLVVLINSMNAAVVPLAKIEDFDAAPQYSYAYDVQDAITGDSKAQYETRNGDVVQGSYSLIEADGTRRIVDYTADPINGFNAVVNREPAVAVAPVPPIVKSPVVAAPIVAKTVVPEAVAVAPVGPIVKSPVVAAPVLAKTVVPGAVAVAPAPIGYTLPRAVATRLSAPIYTAPSAYPFGYTAYL